MQSRILHLSGLHCQSCVLLSEASLREAPAVKSVRVSLKDHQATIEGAFEDKSDDELAALLNPYVTPHKFSLSAERQKYVVQWKDFIWAVPLASGFLLGFIMLQKLGIVNMLTVTEVSYTAAFMIGIIASLSTCMAIVGGLTLSISANFAKEGSRLRPQVLFHIGRLASFFVLGGLIGLLGANIAVGASFTMWVSLAVGIIMLLLGINLLDVAPWTKKLQPTLPAFLSRHLLQVQKLNHNLTPMLLGVITFFLPCGFTQSMQFYALSSGSFTTGAFTMLAFALGTLPVLGALSFASLGLHSARASGIFFKTAGLIVIAFALLNLMNVLVMAGFIQPLVRP